MATLWLARLSVSLTQTLADTKLVRLRFLSSPGTLCGRAGRDAPPARARRLLTQCGAAVRRGLRRVCQLAPPPLGVVRFRCVHPLQKLSHIDRQNAPRFRSVLVMVDSSNNNKEVIAEGTCEGMILTELRGDGGFGYDPLFLVPEIDKTFAELGIGTKNGISHRARAMQILKPALYSYFSTTPIP